MNDLSNTIHTIEDDAKAFFLKALSKLENGLATILSDAKVVVSELINGAGPVVVAAAEAGVSAALANATGGLSALVSAAEGAGFAVLKSQGVQLADQAVVQFETLVRTNVLKANSSPTVK